MLRLINKARTRYQSIREHFQKTSFKATKKMQIVALKIINPMHIAERDFNNVKKREPEFEFIEEMCPAGCNAIDVGVLWGAVAQKLQDYASEVWAFEANPKQVKFLQRCRFPKVRVIHCALSDASGYASMRVPTDRTGHGTIEPDNNLSNRECNIYKVPCQTLDSFEIGNIGFIKIDVEGHELSVLRGGQKTISRSKPNILLESNDKYFTNHYNKVADFMKNLGYEPYILAENTIYKFNCSKDLEKRVSDNIIFIHKTRTMTRNF